MHELSAVESLVQLIEQEGRALGFSRVKHVRVSVGVLGHFDPGSLRFCFDAVSRSTIAEGARLELEMVPGKGWCTACRRTVAIACRHDLCPMCGNPRVEMTAGDELRLVALIVE